MRWRRVFHLPRGLGGRFVGTSGWSTAAVAVSAVTGVLTARGLGAESRGTLALILSIAGLCVLVSALGSNVAIRRHLPQGGLVTLRGYERLSTFLAVPLLIVLSAAAYTVEALVDPTFGTWQVGLAFVAYGVCYFVSNQSLDLLNALGRVVLSARTNALGSVVTLSFVTLVTIFGWGLAAIVLCYATGAVFQAIAAYRVILRTGARNSRGSTGMRTLLRDGSRLLGLNLGQSLTYRTDTVLLGALASPTDVGIYAVAITPASILRIPSNALGQVAFHQVAAGSQTIDAVLRRLVKLVLFMLPLVVVGWIFADWLFVLLYGAEYVDAADSFRLLLIAEIALAPFLVLSRILAGLGSTWGASASGVAGVVVLLVSGLILIPPYAAVGAAMASIAAYSAMSVTAALVLWRMPKESRQLPS
ncbi:MAG: oligosaccharide flippase family protein [Cryobacterium sp.]|nr:oligosaccharide flippase family protein [Cryobacterium sp.]